ncbi:MAG TPA: hypothetical protein VNA16_07475, partial [Abditibacteriaceae bacterium]|nr:hypothetical protein [Abditibacteriaceae bacterium]
KQYGSHGDMVTTVEPEVEYPVRLATEHPIYERDRTRRFAALLATVAENDAAREPLLAAAGDLMIQSHFSYDHRCNLGSPETDAIVNLARQRGTKAGIMGAKITGGGAGGTVAILADVRRHQDMASTLRSIAEEYAAQTGNTPRLLSGSSDGAMHYGTKQITLSAG